MNDLREQIRKAIMRGIDGDNRPNPEGTPTMKDTLDPDTCGRCADEVVATLLSALTGTTYVAVFRRDVIWPASFVPEL